MSEAFQAPTLRKPPVPSARVWQATDLLKLEANEGGFVRTSWAAKAIPAFSVQAVKPWEQELPIAQALREQAATKLGTPAPSVVSEPDAAAEGGQTLSAEALQAAHDAAFAEGLAEGERRVQSAWDADRQSRQGGSQALLLALDAAVRSHVQAPEELHEPLKRLALHLAEQLVLAELSLSPQAIERLVRRAVDELAAPRQAPVLVELNSADLALLKSGTALADALAADRPWQVQANDNLLPGSVKVSANDGVLVDLIENRLEALARGLLLAPDRGLSQSAFTPSRMSSRLSSDRQVEDAQARTPAAPSAPLHKLAQTVEAEAAVEVMDAVDVVNPQADEPSPDMDFNTNGEGPANV